MALFCRAHKTLTLWGLRACRACKDAAELNRYTVKNQQERRESAWEKLERERAEINRMRRKMVRESYAGQTAAKVREEQRLLNSTYLDEVITHHTGPSFYSVPDSGSSCYNSGSSYDSGSSSFDSGCDTGSSD